MSSTVSVVWTRDLHPPAPTPAGFSASSQPTICLSHYVVSLWWGVTLILLILMNINPVSESIPGAFFVIFFSVARAHQQSGNVTMGGKVYILNSVLPKLGGPRLAKILFFSIAFLSECDMLWHANIWLCYIHCKCASQCSDCSCLHSALGRITKKMKGSIICCGSCWRPTAGCPATHLRPLF